VPVRRANLARGDDGHIEPALDEVPADAFGEIEVQPVGVARTRHAPVAAVTRVGVKRLALGLDRVLELATGADREVVRARECESLRHDLRVGDAVPVLDRFLAVVANADHEVIADTLAHPLQHARRHTQPVVHRAPAELVLSIVAPGQKRTQRVRVRHVQFDRVETGLAHPHRGLAVRVHDRVDVLMRQILDALPPPGPADLQEVDDLRRDLGRRRVAHCLRQLSQPRQKRVVRRAQQRSAFRLVHAHGLDDHQARFARGVAHIAIPDGVVDPAVRTAEARHHRR